MNISADLVKSLRESTGVGMMECKKALIEASGDMERAIRLLRESGALKALKKSTRLAKEGIVTSVESEDGKVVACVEVNCETDFVAREARFSGFAKEVAQLVFTHNPQTIAEILDFKIGKQTVEEKRLELIAQLGENITINNFYHHQVSQGVIGCYAHQTGNDLVSVVACVTIDVNNREVAHDLAMQVAAMEPFYISEVDIPTEVLQTESDIWRVEIEKDFQDKPEQQKRQIFLNKKKKFVQDRVLLEQEFIKDGRKAVKQYLKEQGVKVLTMKRMAV